MAAIQDLQIVTGDQKRADCLYRLARRMGVQIRKPISVHAWLHCPRGCERGWRLRYMADRPQILVDDADHVLSVLLNAHVVAAVIETKLGCHCSIVPGGE